MDTVRTSARAILWRGDALLVIHCSDEDGDWYVLPGGGQQNGESLEAALRREVDEETGAAIRVGPLRFVRECIAEPGGRRLPPRFHQVEMVFDAELITAPTSSTVPDPGQLSVEWRTVRELRERAFFPKALLDALERGQEYGYLGVV